MSGMSDEELETYDKLLAELRELLPAEAPKRTAQEGAKMLVRATIDPAGDHAAETGRRLSVGRRCAVVARR